MALLQQRLEGEREAYREMLNWNDFNMQVQGFASSADADALEDFAKLNEDLISAMRKWNIQNVSAAVIREGNGLKVKAIVRNSDLPEPQHVLFEEPAEGFPSEDLMARLKMIEPDVR